MAEKPAEVLARLVATRKAVNEAQATVTREALERAAQTETAVAIDAPRPSR